MIYARKVLEKDGCVIYLAADIKCLDYHTEHLYGARRIIQQTYQGKNIH